MNAENPPVVVLDTNVLVSGFLNPYGAPAAILRLAVRGHVRVAYDARVLAEYREVLNRPKFGLDPSLVEAVLEALVSQGIRMVAPPLRERLPDPDDEPFLELTLAAGPAAVLVTGNPVHFPADQRQGAKVLTPREWLDRWQK